MDADFQDLKRRFGINSAVRAEILEQMKANLKGRNQNKSEYVFKIIREGTIINIDEGDFEDLFAIDGNMNLTKKK